MKYTLIDSLNLTISAMLIVTIVLGLIMYAIIFVGRAMEKYERVQTLLKQAEAAEAESAKEMTNSSVQNISTSKSLFETNKLAKVAALTALAHASQDEPDKRYEIVSVTKK